VAPARLLIVDDDPSVHQLVRTMLRRNEYEVETMLRPAEALKKAQESAPDLVVTDVVMPVMDGWTFVKNLRSSPACALVPVIFLTSQSSTENHIRGFRLGADDYIVKETSFWDLPDRIARSLARKRELEAAFAPASAPRAHAVGALKGEFDQIGLASLLTVLDLGKRGGVLRVRRARAAEEGVLYLVEGRVHRADLRAAGELRGREAVYSLLGWSDGTFEFTADLLRVGDQVGMATTELLLEGARRMDERRARV
jgi:DNA-binding response OmpR family regulator